MHASSSPRAGATLCPTSQAHREDSVVALPVPGPANANTGVITASAT
jgi:hypothetical protein